MSLVYWRAVLCVVVFGGLFAASRFVRAWLAKPLLDEVLVPAASETLKFEAVEGRLWQLGIIIAVTLIVTPMLMFARTYLANWVVAGVRRDVDLAVARKFLNVPLRLHRGGSSGDFLSRALTDAQLACQALNILFKDVLEDSQMLIGGLIAMFVTSWQLALVSILTVPPLMLVLGYFGRRIHTQTRRRQETQGDLSQHLLAILGGIKVIKAFRGHEVEMRAFELETGKYFKRNMKVVYNRVMAKSSTEALNQTVGTVILGIGTWMALNHMAGVTLGTIAAFAMILVTTYKPVKTLTTAYANVMETLAGAERLFYVLDMEEEVPDRPDARPMSGLSHSIRFRDVHFDYGEERGAARRRSRGPPGRGDRDRRSHRNRQEHADRPAAPLPRSDPGLDRDRRRRPARPAAQLLPRPRRGRHPGALPLRRHDRARTSATAGPTRAMQEVCDAAAAASADEFIDEAARRLRHARRRVRPAPVRRPAPAHHDRAGDPRRPRHPRLRRGDERARREDRARRAGRDRGRCADSARSS